MRRKASLLCHSQMNGGSLFYSYNIHFAILCIFVILVQLARCEDDAEIRQKCLSGNEGCAQCIKQHPDCAWCADPRTNISRRCDIKSQLDQSTCAPNHIISPTTEIKVAPQHNLPLGGRRADSTTPIQLEPQQVEIRMKPGDIVEVPFRYLHKIPATGYEVNDFTIQTSEFRSLGLEIEFSVDCNGERIPGRVCAGVKPDQKISFYAKVSLNDCSNSNLIAVSVGIYGYNTVSAIFVSPLCGCDCENPRYQEKRSPKCGYKGNLVCGVCQCDQGKGGDRCECDLNQYGVSSPEDLLNQCREHRTAPVCSSKGKCSCGRCTCEADYIKGKYCECDSANCPLGVDGRFCSGRGECDCGKCVCERGYSGDDCSCSDDPAPCTENQVVCSGNGYCECGKCSCNVAWTGATCSVPQSLPQEESTTHQQDHTTSSSSSEEGDKDDDNEEPQPNATGEILPADPQGQDSREVDDENSPDGALAAKSTMWIVCAINTALVAVLGFWWFF